MKSNEAMLLLNKLCTCITDEMKINQDFANRIGVIFDAVPSVQPKKRSNKRNPAKINPIQLVIDGDGTINEKLEQLSIDELKDIIAEHGMDNAKLAMKWKNKERLVTFILETAQRRSKKGDAFREQSQQ